MTKLSIFAPAKVNLYLHMTGKLDNGYHMLDSLAGFVDVGDKIIIETAGTFSFEVSGPYKDYFSDKDMDCSADSGNLVVRAAHMMARALDKPLDFKIHLVKNLPLASGIGGGSSDAGACIWGLMEWWNVSSKAQFLPSLLLDLGTDVPVCLKCQPSHMGGLGDLISPLHHAPPEVPIILVNPSVPCPTAEIYRAFDGEFSNAPVVPEDFQSVDEFVDFLRDQHNDLTDAAVSCVPEIDDVLSVLSDQDCVLSRMTGSGATCFALFDREAQAIAAMNAIKASHPDWWVKSGHLNRPQRY